MNTHFNVSKACVTDFEYDEDSSVFIFEVTSLNTSHSETHEIPEERAWELLTHYLDDDDLFSLSGNGVEFRTLDDLIEDGLITHLIVQAMFIDNYKTVCASYEDFLLFTDKMKSEHFAAVLLEVPNHDRNTWHFITELYIYRDNEIPDCYPDELKEIAKDLKKQFSPLDDDIIDAFYENGRIHYAVMKEDRYQTIHVDEATIIQMLGKEINLRGEVIDYDGQCIGTMTQPWEFTYRELCEVVNQYGKI